MNKKGYTIIEIIICIALIAGISVISIVTLKKSNDNKEKIISIVKTAADVYYSSNENIKQKLENNYGYLLISIDELKENGMLKDNLEILKSNNIEKYDSVLVYDMDKVEKLINKSEYLEDYVGYIDYQYPYIEKTFIPYLNEVNLENDATFDCETTELFGDNKDQLMYLENYNKKLTKDFKCYQLDEEGNESEIEKITNVGSYNVRYKLNSDTNIFVDRIVNIYDNFDYKLIVNSNNQVLDNYCDDPYWINNDILLKIDTTDTINSHKEYHLKNSMFKWDQEDEVSGSQTENYEKKYSETKSASVQVKYNNNGMNKEKTLTCELKIDTVSPTIKTGTYNNNNLNVTFTDEGGSGLKEYCVGNGDECSLVMKTNISGNKKNISISIDSEIDNNICVWDNAGNKSCINYNVRDIPIISVENKNSVTITNEYGRNFIAPGINLKIDSFNNDLKEINVKYVINNKYEFSELYCKDGDCSTNFQKNYNIYNILWKCENNSECYKDIANNVDSLNDFNVKYDIEVNNGSKINTTTFDLKLNIRKKYLEELGSDNDNNISVKGINDVGNIIFINKSSYHTKNTTGSSSTSHTSRGILYYDLEKEEMSLIGSYNNSASTRGGYCSRTSSFDIYDWTSDSIEYTGCYYQGSKNSDCKKGNNEVRGGTYNFNTKILDGYSNNFTSAANKACSYKTGTSISISEKFTTLRYSEFYTPINGVLNAFEKISDDFLRTNYEFSIKYNILSKLVYKENDGEKKYIILIGQTNTSKNKSYHALIFYDDLIEINNFENNYKDV